MIELITIWLTLGILKVLVLILKSVWYGRINNSVFYWCIYISRYTNDSNKI